VSTPSCWSLACPDSTMTVIKQVLVLGGFVGVVFVYGCKTREHRNPTPVPSGRELDPLPYGMRGNDYSWAKGVVLDADSEAPIAGVQVTLAGPDPGRIAKRLQIGESKQRPRRLGAVPPPRHPPGLEAAKPPIQSEGANVRRKPLCDTPVAITDEKGTYCLWISSGSDSILFQAPGYIETTRRFPRDAVIVNGELKGMADVILNRVR
jgi:hypothetical protein